MMKKQILLFLLAFLPLLAHAFSGEVVINGVKYFVKTAANVAEVRGYTSECPSNLVIPASVEYEGVTCNIILITNEAFKRCTSLTSITIPNSVTSIGDYAFQDCTSLTSITIPNSVASIGFQTFYGCSGLKKVIVKDIAAWCGINFGSNPLSYAHHLYSDENTEITNLIIPNSVTSIADHAFRGCTSLTSITIPNSVTSIGGSAFSGCTSLTSVTIPNSVTSIGDYAFQDCTSLTSITIPNSVTSIGDYAFQDCASLTSITIPNSVTSIGDDAFRGCTSLTSITIPNSVTSIGGSAFSGCTSLTSVTIPNSVTSIGGGAFSDCTSLTSITIPNSVTSIDALTFYGCTSLTSVTIPNSVTSIGSSAFYGCTSLTSITIPNSVTSIGFRAFRGCTSLTSVTIGSGIQEISDYAFTNCPDLIHVYCHAVNVPSTNSNAFDGSYPQYATLHVPDESIENYRNKSPWSQFGTIVGLSGGGGGESNKCAKPTISYDNDNKKLKFGCETEGVEYVYSIKDTDIKQGYDAEVTLTATYEISVYATKAGYENSDKATATLVWGSATFTDTTPATAIEMVPAMEAAMPVLIQNNGGMLTVQGAADGTPISVFTTAGMQAGSAVSQNSRATISTSMQQGDIAIVRIGNRSVKVVLK